jgi:uncharacterized protein HemX
LNEVAKTLEKFAEQDTLQNNVILDSHVKVHLNNEMIQRNSKRLNKHEKQIVQNTRHIRLNQKRIDVIEAWCYDTEEYLVPLKAIRQTYLNYVSG